MWRPPRLSWQPHGWRELSTGAGFEDAINFFDEFGPGIVEHALATLWKSFRSNGKICYCLRLGVDEDGSASFHAYGDVFPPAARESFDLSSARIPLRYLVPDFWTWPVLAIREGPLATDLSGDVVHPRLLEFAYRVNWNVQIRLQCRNRYMGYFNVAALDDSPAPDHHEVLAAAYSTKLEVENSLAYSRIASARANVDFNTGLNATEAAIGALPASDRRLALRHVADMLTSHLGAGWNRAACYYPVADDVLRCLWAQGGDATHVWSETVQRPVGEQLHSFAELISMARHNPYPRDDAYLRAAAGERPIEINNVGDLSNKNVIAQLWRARGDIRGLASEYQWWELSVPPTGYLSTVDRPQLSVGGPMAAVFDQHDAWVQSVVRERPMEPVFVSANGKYFALPWFARGRLIGIWVVDMAYWARFPGQPESPSLVLSSEILSALGPAVGRLLGLGRS